MSTQIKGYVFIIYTDYLKRIGGQGGRSSRQNIHRRDKAGLSIIT